MRKREIDVYDRRLDAISAAAELGSFSRAAAKLRVSTPALVKQVSGFEAEFGITLFLACVGLSVGGSFVEKLLDGGYMWMLYAAAIMMIPLCVTITLGRYWLKLDYFTLLGYVAGNMTFAPALSLTPDASKNNIPAVKYATVYPLTLFVRVMTAQLMILLFA